MLAAAARAARPRLLAGAARRASGVCLTWGDGTDGQLGHPVVKAGVLQQYSELSPRALAGVPAFTAVACGQSHTLAVDEEGRVWSWGKGEHGKLGHGDDADHASPEVVEALAGVKVVKVACGESHSLALDAEGRCYAWGWGGSWLSGGGHLGLGDRETRFSPEPVLGPIGECTVATVGAGEAHSVFLTDDGEVWTCGAGEHGRNGNGGSSDVLAPEPVTALDDVDVLEAAAGSAFTVVRDAEGLVYAWGRNDQGQLGLGGGLAMDVYALEDLPTLVRQPRGSEEPLVARAVAAGHSHVAVVTPDDRLLQWGAKLALEPAEHVFLADDGEPPKPGRVWCGGGYTIVEAAGGGVYSFGQGSSKCLGHGDKRRHPHPTAVEALAGLSVDAVACGFRHVAVLGAWGPGGPPEAL